MSRATPNGPRPSFAGGEIVFYPDRVELCGVDICSGRRSKSRRILLELLSKKREGGEFVAYGGDELENAGQRMGVMREAVGWIRDARDRIEESLRAASISCEGKDVILSGGPGYRFADSLTVRYVGQPASADVDETPSEADEPPVEVRDDLSDGPAAERRAWILQRLASGERLQAPAVAKQLKCSVKTAQRDLAALKNAGRIEYVGDPRKGTYQLCQPPKADG